MAAWLGWGRGKGGGIPLERGGILQSTIRHHGAQQREGGTQLEEEVERGVRVRVRMTLTVGSA